ncbi:PIN domain-containing protein, partial [Acidobacteria bacterium AH-259-A15]|nr:PIN domain-containing protein [Acidobacteria bacterium AH-259-A15]
GKDVVAVDWALEQCQGILPPVVLSELLSDPDLHPEASELLKQLPLLEIQSGYWPRTGQLRAKVIASGHRARLADSLIAQSCIDHEVALITRDRDFANFVRHSDLKLLS